MKRVLTIVFFLMSLAACQASPDMADQNRDGRYGLNTYNTPEVVEELRYIEKNTKPVSPTPVKRVLITGSTAGIGQLTAKTLIKKGYKVVVHARNEKRAKDAGQDLPGAEAVVIGDLSAMDEVKRLAHQINALGNFDVIIHNAGVYHTTTDVIYQVNSLAPYVLTALVHKPKQLIYVSSNLHRGGRLKLESMKETTTDIDYNDSKLHILTLAKAVARKWPDVRSNGVRPGWVATRMGGSGAPDNLRSGYETLVWLVEGKDEATQTTGEFFFQKHVESDYNRIVDDVAAQDALLDAYFRATGVPFPKNQHVKGAYE